MSDPTEFFYDNRVCPECGGHQKNCEHFWAGHVIGQKLGAMEAERRIIKLLKKEQKNTRPGIGQSGVIKGLKIAIALIKGEQE